MDLLIIKIQEDRDFLAAQRKGTGSMAGVDLVLSKKEQRSQDRKRKLEKRVAQEKNRQLTESNSATVESNCSDSGEDDSVEYEPKDLKHRKTKADICTASLTSVLDRRQSSVREAFHIVATTAKALGTDLDSINASATTLYRHRLSSRQKVAEKLKNDFKPTVPLVVHWDGKLISEAQGISPEKVERLAVVVSGEGVNQLLGVPALSSGTGEQQASAVYESLKEWSLHDSDLLIGFSFDTTASNTGRLKGACVLLEQKLTAEKLHLACRHHIYELTLKSVFETCMGPSSGPKILLFERFKSAWSDIDKSKFGPGTDDAAVLSALEETKQDTINFVTKQLEACHPRDDYKEFLKLVHVFLGKTEGARFAPPGDYSQARWMAKALYGLKIFLFRGQFRLTASELRGLRDLCVFVVRFYVIPWFTSRQAALASSTDLKFLQGLQKYENLNKKVADAASTKLLGQLWYLSEDLSVFALFDPDVSPEIKAQMAHNLRNRDGAEEPLKRIELPRYLLLKTDFSSLTVDEFVTKRSMKTLESLKINTSFLDDDPLSWPSNETYMRGKKTIDNVQVVNDCAERAVKLVTDFANSVTKNEAQKQYLLQVVAENRKLIPKVTKKADIK